MPLVEVPQLTTHPLDPAQDFSSKTRDLEVHAAAARVRSAIVSRGLRCSSSPCA